MNKTLERLDSAAGDAVSKEASASVASLYHLKVNDGFHLSKLESEGRQTGETKQDKGGKG